MTEPVPDQAVTAAEAHVLHRATMWLLAASRDDRDAKRDDAALTARRTLIADAVEAAAPAIREAERGSFRAERDLMHADLGDLLEATGLGNFARPIPPHDVMRQAIARVAELEQAARQMFACIGDADYPPAAHIEHWRAVLARTPGPPAGPGEATSPATAATPAPLGDASRTEHAPGP